MRIAAAASREVGRCAYNWQMARFADLSMSAFLDALADATPTPGGGTAAAVAGAMGSALLMMVAGLAKSRSDVEDEKVPLVETRAALVSIRDRFVILADEDADAFNQVMAAYKLAKLTEEDKNTRKQAIQLALRRASDVPLDTLRTAAEAMTHAKIVARDGNRSAASDVRVALELIEAAAAGATANVETNLVSLDDEAYRKAVAAEVLELTNKLTEDAAAARTALL
jgi:methenyltetrahydrofolate cyclohydrolase